MKFVVHYRGFVLSEHYTMDAAMKHMQVLSHDFSKLQVKRVRVV